MAAGISKSFSGTSGKYVSGYGQFDLYIQFSMAETYDTATRKSDLVFSNFQIKAVDSQANTTSYVGGSITVTVNGTAYTIFSATAIAAGSVGTDELADGSVTNIKTDFSAGFSPAGPIILKQGVHYDTTTPATGVEGQLFFTPVDAE